MATRLFSRTFLSNLTTTKAIACLLSRSFSTKHSSPSLSLLFFNRLRPLSAVNVGRAGGVAGYTFRGMATRGATSSLNDNSPNWSNRPPKETILLDGCDFEHWLVVMENPEGDPTRDEIIDRYIKTLTSVVGSEEEARMKIYSVSTRCYFAFGALVDEETSYKLKELPGVRWVLPDSYLDVKNKSYGGEPFINGQAVPYDPKYHEEWIRNNSRANERNRRNDRPRNFDRSRNFEKRENMQNRGFQNQGMQNPASNTSNMPPNNMPPNTNVPPNMGRMGERPPANNFGGPSPTNNFGGAQPPANNYGGAQLPPNNFGRAQPPPSSFGGAQPPPSSFGAAQPPPSSFGAAQPPPSSLGGTPPPPNNFGGAAQPPPNNFGGAAQPPPNNYRAQPPPDYNTGNMGGMPQNAGWSG